MSVLLTHMFLFVYCSVGFLLFCLCLCGLCAFCVLDLVGRFTINWLTSTQLAFGGIAYRLGPAHPYNISGLTPFTAQ